MNPILVSTSQASSVPNWGLEEAATSPHSSQASSRRAFTWIGIKLVQGGSRVSPSGHCLDWQTGNPDRNQRWAPATVAAPRHLPQPFLSIYHQFTKNLQSVLKAIQWVFTVAAPHHLPLPSQFTKNYWQKSPLKLVLRTLFLKAIQQVPGEMNFPSFYLFAPETQRKVEGWTAIIIYPSQHCSCIFWC